MIDSAGGQIGEGHWRCDDGRCARSVREANDAISVGDVERVTDKRHPKWRMQVGQENRFGVGDAVAVAVPQQDDSVLAGNGASRLRLEEPEEKSLGAAIVVRSL